MWRMLAVICATLIVAAAFSMPAQAQRGVHFSGARMGGVHVGGPRVGNFGGARIGAAPFRGPGVGAAPFSGARVAAGRGVYRGGVWSGRYAGYPYGRYGHRYPGYGRYWGWGVAAGALAATWPYYADSGYVGDDYYYGDDNSYEAVAPGGNFGGGGCWVVTDPTRGYGYYGPCY